MNKDKVLVITVGGSPQPIIKSLKEHDPAYIYFIPSSLTVNEIPAIIESVYAKGCNAVKKIFEITDYNDLKECYKKCHESIEDIFSLGLNTKEIIVDLTGGTKIMSGALLLAIADLGLTISYVGGEQRTKDGKGVPINGTERIIYSHHPYDLLARADKERFCLSFNSYRFESASVIAQEISLRAGETLKRIFGALMHISRGYLDWDHFRFSGALHSIDKGLFEIHRLSSDYPEDIKRLFDFIKKVTQNNDYLKSLKADTCSVELVSELVANSCRRAEEGKYDDAVARLYRALEMLAQSQFYMLYGLSTSKFPVEKLHRTLRSKLINGRDASGNTDLGCFQAFEQLALENNEFGILFMENRDQIRALMNQRNSSILAHGTIPLDKGKYDDLYSVFREIFGIDGRHYTFAHINETDLIAVGI